MIVYNIPESRIFQTIIPEYSFMSQFNILLLEFKAIFNFLLLFICLLIFVIIFLSLDDAYTENS